MRATEQFGREDRDALVDRVLHGTQLRGSPKLQSFLQYVVRCYNDSAPDETTEQQIGIHVFGRSPGYNSNGDTIVRSQARLLRQKLEAYFASDGLDEPIVLSIPKGQYLPEFHKRDLNDDGLGPDQALGSLPHAPAAEVIPPSPVLPEIMPAAESVVPPSPKPKGLAFTALLVVLICLATVLGALLQRRVSQPRRSPLDALWLPFWTAEEPALVIYSNPIFWGTPSEGLHLAGPDQAEPDGLKHTPVDDTYTGTGEVAAVYALTKLFSERRLAFTLKRSRLVTWDEARARNLIFVGAPSQNTALGDLPSVSEFTIALDGQGHGYIVNQHPRPGEPAHLPSNDAAQETAIMAFLPAPDPKRHILIFSGLTTLGTQAAVEYACDPANVATLSRLAGRTGDTLQPFEAVLQVGLSKGVAISTKLLFLHQRSTLSPISEAHDAS